MNFVLQKKIKDLTRKIQLKTIEEMAKNGKININSNINNININTNITNFKNKDKDKEKYENYKTESTKENNKDKDEENMRNITPENYTILKSCQFNREFKWYLLRKKYTYNDNASPIKMYIKKYNKNNFKDEIVNLDDSNNYNYTYSDFVWIPAKNKKELEEFGDLPLSESFEQEKIIRQLESNIKILENKLKKKEKEYNLLNINYSKLVYRNKNEKIDKLFETIDRLKSENRNLNKRLSSYSSKNNYIGLSFIEQDENNNSFLEDKCLEEILDELDNNDINENNYFYNDNYNNNYNNNYYNHRNGEYNNGTNRNVKSFKEKMYFNTATKFYPNPDSRRSTFKKNTNEMKNKEGISISNLKSSIDSLMTQIEPSQNARAMFANILRQLGCSDEDIYKLIGNYRGVISIPISNLKNKK
jgi:hypothetical protein